MASSVLDSILFRDSFGTPSMRAVFDDHEPDRHRRLATPTPGFIRFRRRPGDRAWLGRSRAGHASGLLPPQAIPGPIIPVDAQLFPRLSGRLTAERSRHTADRSRPATIYRRNTLLVLIGSTRAVLARGPRLISSTASANSHSRNVTIFGRLAVALGQTIQ